MCRRGFGIGKEVRHLGGGGGGGLYGENTFVRQSGGYPCC